MDTFEEWNPGKLLETSGYFWKTCTLHAGVKLDIFTIIGNETVNAETVASGTGSTPDSVSRLLDALSAMKLLNKTDGCYNNTPPALKFLSRDSDAYIGFMIMHHHHLVSPWSKLDEAVLNGKPIKKSASHTTSEFERESFLMGMFNMGMAVAPGLVKKTDLGDAQSLIDLGGGPGTFAIHFCMENPNLKATVFDLPTTKPFAEKTIRRFHMEERVSYTAGNYVEEKDFQKHGKFDAAFLSHILHGEGPDTVDDIIKKTVEILNPSGRILIHEFILHDAKDGPLFPALFSLNMLVGTSKGRSYSEKELFSILQKHGVKNIERLDFKGPTESGIISGII